MTLKQTPKTLATMQSALIQAVIGGHYRFKTSAEALKKIRYLKSRYVQSKQAPHAAPIHTAVIWVRDYALTEPEIEAGLKGNFALIAIEQQGDRFVLVARKLEAEAKYHPTRLREKKSVADFGHYVLRRVQKQFWYATPEDAGADLQALAADFPSTCIPGENKCYAMIYRKAAKGDKPIQRYVLEVVPHPQGGFMITCRVNEYVAKKKPVKKPETSTALPSGKFTAKEQIKRAKKKR